MPMFASLAGSWSSFSKIFKSSPYWLATGTFNTNYSNGVTADSDGNLYMRTGPVLTKMSIQGTILWSFSYVSVNSASNPVVHLDSDENIILPFYPGSSTTQGCILKISKVDGSIIWTRGTTNSNTGWFNIAAVGTDNSGNIYFGCDNGVSPDSSLTIVKLDTNGNVQWQKALALGASVNPSFFTDRALTIIANNDFVYFGGMVSNSTAAVMGSLSTNGDLLWIKSFKETGKSGDFTSIVIDSNQDIYFGQGGQNNNSVTKVTPNGTVIWSKAIETSAGVRLKGNGPVSIDKDNNIFFSPTNTIPLIITYNTSGTLIGQKLISSTTRTLSEFTNIKALPGFSSIFVAMSSTTNTMSYGILPSIMSTYSASTWRITNPTYVAIDVTNSITTISLSPTVTSIVPTMTTVTSPRTSYTPTGIVITQLT